MNVKDVVWKNVVKNGGLKICSPMTAKAKGVFPNRIAWLADDPKIAGIVVFKSQNGDDFPLSQASVNYLRKGKAEGRVEEDFILFLRRGMNGDLEFVNAMTLEEVQGLVRNLPLYEPNDASRGPYWWLPGTQTVDEEVPGGASRGSISRAKSRASMSPTPPRLHSISQASARPDAG